MVLNRTMTTIAEVEVHPEATQVRVTLRTDRATLQHTTVTPTRAAPSTPTVDFVARLAGDAAQALRGHTLAELTDDMAATWRLLRNHAALAGPLGDDAIGRTALAAVVNAVWELWARSEGVALWQLLVELDPAHLVATFDDTEIGDLLASPAATALLRPRVPGKATREGALRRAGFPAALQLDLATGSVDRNGGGNRDDDGDEALRAAAAGAIAAGWDAVRLRLRKQDGIEGDRRRALLVRAVVGPGCRLLLDAAGAWTALDAADRAAAVAEAGPVSIDDPVDGLDAVALIRIREALPSHVDLAVGASVSRAVVFKQLLSRRLVDAVRPDPTVLGGINETLAVLVLAARYNTPAIPTSVHADADTPGGAAAARLAAQLAFVDYVSIGASLDRIAVVPTGAAGIAGPSDDAVVDRGRLLAHPTAVAAR